MKEEHSDFYVPFRSREINIDNLEIDENEYELVKGKKLKVILDNLFVLFYKNDENYKKEENELIRLLFGLKYHIEKERIAVMKFMVTNGYSFEMISKVVEIFINYL